MANDSTSLIDQLIDEGESGKYYPVHYLIMVFCGIIVYVIYWLATFPTDDIEADMKARGLSPQQLLAEAEGTARLPTTEQLQALPGFTVSELAQYKTGAKLLVGIKGYVFDVSGKDVYMGGGGYQVFAGKDASCALAKMKFDDELMDPSRNHWSKDLNEKEMKVLNDWVDYYAKRYPIVGKVIYSYHKKDQ
jgi:predicted heme/steroid binding protein